MTILGGFGVLLLLEPLLSRLPYMGENTLLIYIFVLMSSLRSLCSQFVRAKGYVKLYALDGLLSTATTIFFNVLYLVVLKWGINGYILAMVSADTLSTIFLFYIAGLRRYLHLARAQPPDLQGDAALLHPPDSKLDLLVGQQYGQPLPHRLLFGGGAQRPVRRLQPKSPPSSC